MSMKLYHFTTRASAEAIVRGGFDGGNVWLSPDVETPCGEAGRSALVEVELDATEAELAPFRREVTEEEIDAVSGEAVPGGETMVYSWYEVPVAALTGVRVRVVPEDERRAVMAY